MQIFSMVYQILYIYISFNNIVNFQLILHQFSGIIYFFLFYFFLEDFLNNNYLTSDKNLKKISTLHLKSLPNSKVDISLRRPVENRDFLSENLELVKNAVHSEYFKGILNIYFFYMCVCVYECKCMYGNVCNNFYIIHQIKENILIL